MTNIKNTLKKPTVSASAFLSLVISIVVTMSVFWPQLPAAFLAAMIPILVIATLSQLTGIKKVGFKEAVDIIKENIAVAKVQYPNDPTKVLNSVETAVILLMKVWDRAKDWVEDVFDNKDGKRDGKKTPLPEDFKPLEAKVTYPDGFNSE